MTAAAHSQRESPGRHSAFAWAAAVAFSVAVLAARFQSDAVLIGASALLIGVVVAWIAEKRMGALAAVESRAIARLRIWGSFAVVAFCIWTGALVSFVFRSAYLDPSTNRAYTEGLGIELTLLLAAVVAIAVAVTVVAVLALLALRRPAPGSSQFLWTVSIAAPIASVLLALTPMTVFADLQSEWRQYGADLPGPTLLYMKSHAHWWLVALPAVGLVALAWRKRDSAIVYSAGVVGTLLVLMLCSALLTFAVTAAWLPVMKMCVAI